MAFSQSQTGDDHDLRISSVDEIFDSNIANHYGLHNVAWKGAHSTPSCKKINHIFSLKNEMIITDQDVTKILKEDINEDPYVLAKHLVNTFTELDVSDIESFLSTNVPEDVNKACLDLENNFFPYLSRAATAERERNQARQCGSDKEETTSAIADAVGSLDTSEIKSSAFYHSLKVPVANLLEAGDTKAEGVYQALLRVVVKTSNNGPFNCMPYHISWTNYIKSLLFFVMSTSEKIVNKPEIRSNGEANLGFLAYCSSPTSNCELRQRTTRQRANSDLILNAKPDALVVRRSPLMSVRGDLAGVELPVLAVEVKTTYTHTASYVPGQIWGTSSERSSPAEINMMSDPVSLTPDMISSDSDEEYLAESKKTKKAKENTYCSSPKFAEQKQLNRLVTQHLLQLIGSVKWSNAIVVDHERQVKKLGEESSLNVEYHMNINNIGAYGLFIFQHRVYPTHLKIVQHDNMQNDWYENVAFRTIIRDWGLNRDQPYMDKASSKFKVVGKYLDIFEPTHLKALLIYLRVIIWGQSPFDKNQPKPTIQHKD